MRRRRQKGEGGGGGETRETREGFEGGDFKKRKVEENLRNMEFQVVPGGTWGGEEVAVPGYDVGGYDGSVYPSYGKVCYVPVGKGAMVPGPYVHPQAVVAPTENMYVPGYAPVAAPLAPAAMPLMSTEAKDLEAARMRLKPRWETPRRRGTWTERWQSAKDMGTDSVPLDAAARVGSSIRRYVSKIININVGLPISTVEKWFHLLAEYLELSADEHVIMVTLFRKYVSAHGPLVSSMDWARPQKWECVLAVACYLSVLLSEEFAGQTAKELKDLLGPQFRFGAELSEFLKTTDWRINVSAEEFAKARDVFLSADGTHSTEALLHNWFSEMTNKSVEKKNTAGAAPAVGKKRTRVEEDDVVPGAKKQELIYDDEQTVPSWN